MILCILYILVYILIEYQENALENIFLKQIKAEGRKKWQR